MPPGVNRNTQARVLHQRHWLLTAGPPKTSERSRQASTTWRTNVPTHYAHTKWPRKPSKSPVTVLPSLPTRCQHQGHRRQNPLLDKLTATPWASATNWPREVLERPVHRGPGSEPREALERTCTPRPRVRAQGSSREACTPQPRVRAQGSSREGLYTTAPGQSPARGLRPLSCYDGQRTGPHSRLHLVLKGQAHSP